MSARTPAAALSLASAVLALALSVWTYADVGNGVAHSGGTQLAILLAALSLLGALLLARLRAAQHGAAGVLGFLLALALPGAIACAFMLDTRLLCLVFLLEFAACMALVFAPGLRAARGREGRA